MNDNHQAATIYALDSCRHAETPAWTSSAMSDAAIAAAARLQKGAAALSRQVEANKELVAQVERAAGNLAQRAEALRASTDKFLAALQEEMRKDA